MSQPPRLRSLVRGRRLPHAWSRLLREPARLSRPADEQRAAQADAPRPLPAEHTPTAALATQARKTAPAGQLTDRAVRSRQATIARPRRLSAFGLARPTARTVDPRHHTPREHLRLTAGRPVTHALVASHSNATRLEAPPSRLVSTPSTPLPEIHRQPVVPVLTPSKALPEARQGRPIRARELVGVARYRDASPASGLAVAARPLPSAPAESSAVEDGRQWAEMAALPGSAEQAFEDGTLLERTAAAVQARLMPALAAATTRRVDARLSDLLG